MMIIEYLIPLLFFILLNGTVLIILKKSFGKCIPISIMISAFILYISQMIFNTFYIGISLNILLSILGIILYIFYLKKDKNKSIEIRKNFFSNGLIIFIVLYTIIYIYDIGKHFNQWDDFMHWGVMLKEMIRLDKFYNISASTLSIHKEYPPIVSIFEMFYTRISFGELDTNAIRAIHLLEISFYIPILSKIKFKKNNIIKTCVTTVLMILIIYESVFIFDIHESKGIIDSIYIDYFISILVGYILFNIVISKNMLSKFNLINLSLSISFMLLSKQISILFYAIILITIILVVLTEHLLNKKNIQKIVLLLSSVIIIPILAISTWYINTNKTSIYSIYSQKPQFEISKININQFSNIINRKSGEKFQQDVSNDYISALTKKNITVFDTNISYITCFIITTIILIIILAMSKKTIKNSKSIILVSTILLSNICYCFAILNTYTFLMNIYETQVLSSYDRYMATIIIVSVTIIIMLYINYISEKNSKVIIISTLATLTVLLILLFENNYKHLTKKIDYYDGLEDAKIIEKQTDENAKIYIISRNSTEEILFRIKYYSNPRIMNQYDQNWITGNKDNIEYYKEYLQNFDYIYTQKIDKEYTDTYSAYFENNTIEEKKIYKIIHENKNILFKIKE